MTRPLTLTAELEDGEARVALAVTGELHRGDYGVTPGRVLDLLVSERVALQLDIAAVEQRS